MPTSPTPLTRLLTGIPTALALLVLTAVASAQDSPGQLDKFPLTFGGAAQKKAEPKVTASLYPVRGTVAELKAGDEVELAITIDVPAGSYIYSQTTPKGGPTRFTIEEAKGLEAVTERFVPDRKPKSMFDPIFEGDVEKFTAPVTWTRRYKIAAGADPKAAAVTGRVDYQVCDDASCRPLSADIRATIGPRPEPKPKAADSATTDEAASAPAGNVLGTWIKEQPIEFREEQAASVTVTLTPTDAKPGERVTLSIHVQMAEGWHTYSTTQPEGNFARTTEIRIAKTENLQPIGDGFEPDRPFRVKTEEFLPGETATQEVYEGEVTWSREYVVEPATTDSAFGVTGEVGLQVCKKSCIWKTISFDLGNVQAADAAVTGTRSRGGISPSPSPSTETDATAAAPAKKDGKDGEAGGAGDTLRSQGMLAFIGWAALSGALALLTPCVFPMIPITVSFFLKHAEKEHHRPTTLALVYSGSIVLAFTVFGILMAVLFGAASLNQLANNLWLNLLFGAVFILFGISMLGFFEISVPSWLLTWSSNKEQQGGFAGAIFMALTFTLVSFTCTFPVAGSVLVLAANGEFLWPIIGMLTFSAVFALPFFVLALFPSYLKSLPKSGGWMTNVKTVLGLLEIAAAVKFLSVAELAWHQEAAILSFHIVLIVWFAVAVLIALYILGLVRFPYDTNGKLLTVPRILLSLPFLLIGWRLLYLNEHPYAPQGWLDEQFVGLAPPKFEGSSSGTTGAGTAVAGSEAATQLGPVKHLGPLTFALDYERAKAYARQAGKPLLLDFTGVTCSNCRTMETKMVREEWQERLDEFVLVALYVDLMPKHEGIERPQELLERNRKLQLEWFGELTMPAYAIVTPEGDHVVAPFPEAETIPGTFVKFLDAGLEQWRETREVQTASMLPAANAR